MLELQAVDTTIDRLEARRRQLEEGAELMAARGAMEDAEGRLGELRLASDAVVREQQRLEHEIDSMTQRAGADEKRLYDGSVANMKELQALQHEIANLKDRRARVEDELLEQMVRKDDLEGRVVEAGKVATEARDNVEAVGAEAVRELEQIDTSLKASRETREALVPEFDVKQIGRAHV